jgi:hypothetical protein
MPPWRCSAVYRYSRRVDNLVNNLMSIDIENRTASGRFSSNRHRAVVVRLMGGLGNQLFQFAMALRLEQLYGVSAIFDDTWLSTFRVPRSNELLGLGIIEESDCLSSRRKGRLWSSKPRFIQVMHLASRVNEWLQPWHYIKESDASFQGTFCIPDPSGKQVIGYWQAEDWFAGSEGAVAARISQALGNMYISMSADADWSRCVAVHVRLGDYTNDPANAEVYHSTNYHFYREAIAEARSRLGDFSVVVFSDEPDKALNMIKQVEPTARTVPSTKTSGVDMFLMSRCAGIVTANSSYSWWAGWLGERNGAIVIAPTTWYNDRPNNPAPKRWQLNSRPC